MIWVPSCGSEIYTEGASVSGIGSWEQAVSRRPVASIEMYLPIVRTVIAAHSFVSSLLALMEAASSIPIVVTVGIEALKPEFAPLVGGDPTAAKGEDVIRAITTPVHCRRCRSD